MIRTNIIIVIIIIILFYFSAVEPCLALSLLFLRTRDFYLEKLLSIQKTRLCGYYLNRKCSNNSFVCVCIFFFFLLYHVSMKWSFLTRDRISFGGFVCLSDPFWTQACCASHHIFAANATMPQIHATSCFVALFFFVSYFVFSCLIIPYLFFYVRCCNHASFF